MCAEVSCIKNHCFYSYIFTCFDFLIVSSVFIGTHVDCISCDTPLGKIPETSIPFSDHEAVVAQLHVFKSLDGKVFKYILFSGIVICLKVQLVIC